MKNKWRFFAVILAVVLCMTVFSVTAYAGGGDMVDSTMGDPTMETPTATTQPENTNTGEQTPNGQTLTVLVTENADGSHTVTIGDRSWTLPAKREQAGKVVNVRTYLNLRTGPGTDYTVIGRLLNGAEVKVLEESNGWYKVVVPEQTGYVCGKYLDVMNAPTENSGNDTDMAGLPELLRNLGAYLKKPVIWLTVIFAVWLVFCAWRGIRAENRMDVLITDVKGFMWLLLVPVLVATVRSRQRLRVLLSWVLAGAVIQAAVILAVNAGVVLMDDPAPLCRWLNEHAVGIVDVVSARLVRVFFKSSPYMVVACVIALFRQAQAPKLRWRYVLAVSLLLCALLLSFTRSLYGALGLTAVLSITAVLILCPAGRKRVLAFLLAVVVCFGVMSTVQEIVLEGSYLSFAVSRTVGREIPASWASQLRQRLRGDTPGNQPDSSEMDSQRSYIEVTERSDQLRQETKDGLKVYIRRSPVIGCGLGASAANREKGVDEYFYLDMLARTGIVGLVLYILPFGYVVLWCLRRRSLLRECPEGAAVVCGLCTFWVVTWFNPWMNAVLGIAWYAVTLSVPQALEEQNA